MLGKIPLHCLIYQHKCSVGIYNVDVGKTPTECHRNVTEMDKSRKEFQKELDFLPELSLHLSLTTV